MKIIKFETNSQFEKSLVALLDLALKAEGVRVIEHTNVILNSIQDVSEEKVAAPEVVTEIIATENQE